MEAAQEAPRSTTPAMLAVPSPESMRAPGGDAAGAQPGVSSPERSAGAPADPSSAVGASEEARSESEGSSSEEVPIGPSVGRKGSQATDVSGGAPFAGAGTSSEEAERELQEFQHRDGDQLQQEIAKLRRKLRETRTEAQLEAARNREKMEDLIRRLTAEHLQALWTQRFQVSTPFVTELPSSIFPGLSSSGSENRAFAGGVAAAPSGADTTGSPSTQASSPGGTAEADGPRTPPRGTASRRGGADQEGRGPREGVAGAPNHGGGVGDASVRAADDGVVANHAGSDGNGHEGGGESDHGGDDHVESDRGEDPGEASDHGGDGGGASDHGGDDGSGDDCPEAHGVPTGDASVSTSSAAGSVGSGVVHVQLGPSVKGVPRPEAAANPRRPVEGSRGPTPVDSKDRYAGEKREAEPEPARSDDITVARMLSNMTTTLLRAQDKTAQARPRPKWCKVISITDKSRLQAWRDHRQKYLREVRLYNEVPGNIPFKPEPVVNLVSRQLWRAISEWELLPEHRTKFGEDPNDVQCTNWVLGVGDYADDVNRVRGTQEEMIRKVK